MLTVALVAETLPTNMKTVVTQSLVDRINSMDQDPGLAAAMRENFVSYTSVLQEGKFKLDDYLNAVKFVSYLLMRYSKRDAWIRTFPDWYQELVARGENKKTISSHVAMYASGKLVNLVLERSIVPFHVINQDLRQRALDTLAREMVTADSSFVKVTAANAILQHLTPPKELVAQQINVNIGAASKLSAMEASMTQLVQQQKKMIEAGNMTAKTLAASSLVVDAEVEPA